MTAGFLARSILRESRGSAWRLSFFVACLAVGVAAVVAVAGHSAAVEQGIRRESRQLLAADLSIDGRRPPPAEVVERLRLDPRLETAWVREMPTTVSSAAGAGQGGASRLVELKAVDPGYPFYGTLGVTPPAARRELEPDAALAAPELLRQLGLGSGDALAIGGEPFRIVGALDSEPDRIAGAFTLGPRLLISSEGLARTNLERFGSQIDYRLLVRFREGPTVDLDRLAASLRQQLDSTAYSVETHAEAQPALRGGIRRMGRFLGLVALLSLLLGGVGVALTTRSWLAGRMDAMAVLRCLGMRPNEVVALYLGQTACLGLAGSLTGVALGVAVQALLPRLAGDLLPIFELSLWQPAALGRGVALGVGTAILFSLGPLLEIRRVSPLRVLRRDAEPIPASARWRIGLATVVALGVWGTAWAQAGSWRQGLQFAIGLAVATFALAGAGWVLTRLATGLRHRVRGAALRHGLAGLGRPGAATLGSLVALGLGVLLVVGIGLVQRGLGRALLSEVPAAAPSVFMIDIQPSQWAGVRQALEGVRAEAISSVPVITARLREVAGTPVALLAEEAEGGSRRWALTREQRLTVLERLPDDNRITAGELWSDPASAEISVEEEFAADLGLALGDSLLFDVQGVAITLTVTSLRAVDWRSFGINFFLVAEPGALDEAPQVRVATARLAADAEQELQDALAARYPNVTLIRIREVLEKIAAVLERLAAAVRFLGGFTALAGILILAGAVSATTVHRGREIALLKTLGMTRRQVVAAFALEHAVIGLGAGTIGVLGGNVLAWAVLTRGLELGWTVDPGAAALALMATVLLTAITGVAAGWRALVTPPLAALQAE